MVPHIWVEQILPKERDFESRASTNSANGAKHVIVAEINIF